MARHLSALTARELGLELTEDEEPLDVLDLPQLYTKPSAKTLLSTLADISSQPPSWEATPSNGTPRSPMSGTTTPARTRRKVKSEGLPSYLTRIISSPLAWIADDGEKEQVWEAASLRLSERSGRTAMGAISRTFSIPTTYDCADKTKDATHTYDDSPEMNLEEEWLDFTLHEPALTSDNLGFKTWASSYLLAKRIGTLRHWIPPSLKSGGMILELGAGTGLVGLAAAGVLRAHVILTDLPDIVPNLERNAHINASILAARNARVTCAVLDWSDPASFNLEEFGSAQPNSFPVILAADPIYSTEHPRVLAQAIGFHLCKSAEATVIVEMPLRVAYSGQRDDFRHRMENLGLGIVEDGEEFGFDDWASGTDADELIEVRCWWSVWRWHP